MAWSNELKPKWGMVWLRNTGSWTSSNLSIQLLKTPARASALAVFFTPEPPDDLHGKSVIAVPYCSLHKEPSNATQRRAVLVMDR